jgi:hypothetical protein
MVIPEYGYHRKFLFRLPFPQARPMTIADMMDKAQVEGDYSTEIQDLVDELIRLEVFEVL